MQFARIGTGKPLVLVHGLGGSRRSWEPILDDLAAQRELIVLDLPGFGATPPLRGPVSIDALAEAVTSFLDVHDLIGVDVVGSSMGARLVLELARRGVVGSVLSLDPGGFWRGPETLFFEASISVSLKLVNVLQPVLPAVVGNPAGRSLLLAQFSAHPWSLPKDLVLQELQNFSASPSFAPLLHELVHGPRQPGANALSDRHPITIGWGRYDRVCFPAQAARAQAAFPSATLHWFEHSGHFPMWDSPQETVRLILSTM